MKKITFAACFVGTLILVWLAMTDFSRASETLVTDDDYDQVQAILNQAGEGESISFADIVKQLLSGQLSASLESLGKYIVNSIFGEIRENGQVLRQILGIALIGAVFTNFSMALSKNYVAETGFYMTYIILITLIAAGYGAASLVAVKIIGLLTNFMTALVPVFCTALAFASGISTSTGFYSLIMVLITAIDCLISKLLLNLINVYLVLSLVNHLSKENYLSRLADLLHTIISWSLKTVLGVTIGLNMIQGIVMPAFDSLKGSLFMRVTTLIPGVGNAMNAAAKTAIGSGVLIKNAIGIGGLIVILIVCAVPVVKLAVISLMYKLTEAVVQPVSDQRVIDCIHSAGNCVVLLLAAVGTTVLLFVLSLAMMTSSTNLALGG